MDEFAMNGEMDGIDTLIDGGVGSIGRKLLRLPRTVVLPPVLPKVANTEGRPREVALALGMVAADVGGAV
jgi:hypothetical protein